MTTHPTPKKTLAIGDSKSHLTIMEIRPDQLLIAKCDCGFPAVILPVAHWGHVISCPACYPAAIAQAQRDAELDRRRQEAEERTERKEAQMRDVYVLPHYPDLSKADKRVFRMLADVYMFDRVSLSSMLRCSYEEAWAVILRLLDANCLLEHYPLPDRGVRQYSTEEPYSMRASSASQFSSRPAAVRQMEKLEEPEPPAPAAPAEVPAPPDDLSEAVIESVNRFVAEMCVTSPGASESQIVLNARYHDWCSDQRLEAVSVEELGRVLDQIGYGVRDSKRLGLRLKLARERAGR